ncbi:hypothetical protein N9D95_02300 [Flavobacteriales bacterium]|nr:hypothetical protein [Flavobacteriales bacterium]
MNRLFTFTAPVLAAFLFVAISTAVRAQTFPLPYNPDENGDGLIGVVDLQGLLANYGSEFSGAVISEDGENAITYMGEMAYPLCAQSCRNLPGMWDISTIEDLGLIWDEVGGTKNANASDQIWITLPEGTRQFGFFGKFNNSQYSWGIIQSGFGGQNGNYEYDCYCAARQLPRVEYSYCEGTDIQECANEKVEDGWYPLEGITKISYNGQNKIQAFWRWAE